MFCVTLSPQAPNTSHNTYNLRLSKHRRCCDRTSSHLQVPPAPSHGSRINLQLPVNSHVPPKVISAPNGGGKIAQKGSAWLFPRWVLQVYCPILFLECFRPRRLSHRLHVDRFWSSRLDSPPTITGRDIPTSFSDLSTNSIPCDSLRRPIRRYYSAVTTEMPRPDRLASSVSLTERLSSRRAYPNQAPPLTLNGNLFG